MNQRRAYRSYVSFIDRSREYYAAQGYSQPYSWACHDDAPFTPLKKPLSQCRVALVTTAGKMDVGAERQVRRKTKDLYAMAANPAPTRMFTADLLMKEDLTGLKNTNTHHPQARPAGWGASIMIP